MSNSGTTQQTSVLHRLHRPLWLAQNWSEQRRKNRATQRQKKSRESLSLDWLKTSSQSARSGARDVCSSLKFSLTRTVSSSIQDLFIGSLMLTQRVFNVRNTVAFGWKKKPFFFTFPPAFFLSWCQSTKQRSRQAEISLKPISYLFKEVRLLEWGARPRWNRHLRVFIKLPISLLTFVTTTDHKKALVLPSFTSSIEQWETIKTISMS